MATAFTASKPERLVHLLKSKEYRVWCRPDKVPGDFDTTTAPSKTNCGNCLTIWRTATTGKKARFHVSHISGRKLPWEE
jgi:hypothetical protein